jgi:SAM-dependent methyltransferase
MNAEFPMLLADTLTRAPTTGDARTASRDHAGLASAFAALNVDADADGDWAMLNYKRTITEFRKSFGARRLIEIGGGRDPLFNLREIEQLDVEMTINDILPGELAVLPPGYRTARFDIAGDATQLRDFRGKFDFAFSRMVFEHVSDGKRAWENLFELLAPGGAALTYIPTLYTLPFVVNWLLPDKLAAAIVKAIYKNRTDDEDPVFPARYSWCFTDARLTKMLSEVGYRDVFVLPMYGHGYYKPLPSMHGIQRRFAALARRKDWRALTSFAFIAVRK